MHEAQDIAFDGWSLRPTTGELFRDGACLRLQDRSLQILTLLLSQPGQLVTREELIAHLWPKGVVDYDTGINTAMRKLRIALNDDPDSPRYIETVPRKGYRFIGKIEPAPPLPAVERTGERRATRGYRVAIAAVIAIGLFVGAITLYEWRASITRAATPAAPRTAIAVLPFANLTGDASKEYLGDGMAEELINTLNKVQGMKVPARTSTFAYKGRNTDIRQIAKDLGVGTILQGSVRAADKRIRISAQLINAQDGLHIWSESYDEEFTDLFKLQDTLATAIVTALQPNLLAAAEVAVAQGPPTRDVEAYNLYLQGVSLLQRPSEQNAAKATDYFQQALARDPKFARAYAMIARAHMTWGSMGGPAEHFAAAERAARQALALDPNLAIGHSALASISAVRLQYAEMEAHRRAAVSLAPNDGYIRGTSATLPVLGYLKQALEESGKAYALAPANPSVVAMLAYQHALAGHDREAAKYADAAIDLGFPKENFLLSATYELIALRAKRYADAAEIFTKAVDVREPDQVRTAEVARLVYAALAVPSRRNAALAARARLYPTSGTAKAAGATHTDPLLCMKSAYYYALMAAYDVAYGLANQCSAGSAPEGHRAGGPGLFMWWIPDLRAFRQDPRFHAFHTQNSLMEVWQQYGPPDDCDLKDGKLTCH